jgi:hypothetical protein
MAKIVPPMNFGLVEDGESIPVPGVQPSSSRLLPP